jgi:uncharacterized membrane protein YfcA
MKPFGGAVHLKHGTVHKSVVRWLAMGSVPGALLGVLISTHFRGAPGVENALKIALGVALLLAVAGISARAVLDRRRLQVAAVAPAEIPVRRIPTLLVGLVGGIIVGLTSVGSGSLMIVALMMFYPRLSTRQLVGTDLVQAVPLVAAAALGHMLFGDVKLPLTAALLIGAIPGVIMGARMSAVAPSGPLRWALAVVLSASGVKLLGASNGQLLLVLCAGLIIGVALLLITRRTGVGASPLAGSAAPVSTVPVSAAPISTVPVSVGASSADLGDSGLIPVK